MYVVKLKRASSLVFETIKTDCLYLFTRFSKLMEKGDQIIVPSVTGKYCELLDVLCLLGSIASFLMYSAYYEISSHLKLIRDGGAN
jgi:hypothetical protein